MGNRALVLGATGLVGRALTERLADTDPVTEVIALTRRPVKYTSPRITNRVIDFERMEEYANDFRGDTLFSCLGTTKKKAGSIAAQRRVDLDMQLTAARIAARQGVPHYLLVSSSGADANSFSPYLKMKGELEDAVQQLPFPRISIFRPSLLLGARDEQRIGETLGAWCLPLICRLPVLNRYRPIQASAVAQRMVDISQQPGNARECFELEQVFPE